MYQCSAMDWGRTLSPAPRKLGVAHREEHTMLYSSMNMYRQFGSCEAGRHFFLSFLTFFLYFLPLTAYFLNLYLFILHPDLSFSFLPFSHSLSSPPFHSHPAQSSPLFLFSKGKASHRYQPSMAYQQLK